MRRHEADRSRELMSHRPVLILEPLQNRGMDRMRRLSHPSFAEADRRGAHFARGVVERLDDDVWLDRVETVERPQRAVSRASPCLPRRARSAISPRYDRRAPRACAAPCRAPAVRVRQPLDQLRRSQLGAVDRVSRVVVACMTR